MKNPTTLALLAAALLTGALAVPAKAEAQTPTYRVVPPPPAFPRPSARPAPADAAEERAAMWRSIERESSAATALYVTSVVSLVGAAVMPLFSFFSALGCLGSSVSDHGRGSGSCDMAEALLYTGAGLGALGLLALPIAIGLDVDSGSRRGEAKRARVTLRPTASGLLLSGQF